MSYRSRYDNGDWLGICDACGRKFKASHLKQRWDGLMVCSHDWEPRHPQDYVRGVADIQAPPYSRPESANTFITIKYDRYVEDQVSLSDFHSFNFVKSINPVNRTAYVLNGFSLNSHNINASVLSSIGNPEDIRIEETVSIFTGFGEAFSDSLKLTEIIRVFTPTAKPVNGSCLNFGAING